MIYLHVEQIELVVAVVISFFGLACSLFASDTPRSALAVRAVVGVIDVLLGVRSHKERRHVHHLLANLDMTLSDHDTGVVDGLGDAKLEHLSLKATLKQLLCGKLENTIQVPFVLVQDPEAG